MNTRTGKDHTANMPFRKSSYSGANNDCVEVREAHEAPTTVDLRDSQNREQGHLTFPADEWVYLLSR